jgi:hypothetical protein
MGLKGQLGVGFYDHCCVTPVSSQEFLAPPTYKWGIHTIRQILAKIRHLKVFYCTIFSLLLLLLRTRINPILCRMLQSIGICK